MKSDRIARQLRIEVMVGVFVLLIFVLLAYFTIILSGDVIFRPEYEIEVVFERVMGLRDGDRVGSRGMSIGKVERLELLEDGVHVYAALDIDVKMHEGYRVTIVPVSVLGGRYMDVDAGPDEGALLPGDMVFKGDSPYDLMADASELINQFRVEFVAGGAIENLRMATEGLRKIVERVESGKGTLGRLLAEDDTLYDDLASTMTSLKTITKRIENGQGVMGKLLSEDDQMYEDLQSMVASLKEVSGRLEAGEGTIGRLLSKDDQLYEDLAASVKSLRAITGKIERGEGGLGKLMSDDELYNEIEAAVAEARATLDDFRESSPIVTFTSIFFGAF
jgi:phospholipid/cholesterol/gamma-HCH transport system substrate-binding protein